MAFLGGLGAGMAIVVLALVGIVGWVLTKTPERVERLKQTGSTETLPVARMRAAPLEPEERARNAMLEEAIEKGAQNLIALAAENGKTLSYKDAKARAKELVEQVYSEESGS